MSYFIPKPRTAQLALFSIFVSFGLMCGLWAASIPLLQTRLSLPNDMLGASIFCFGLGAVLATFVVPKYIERHQTRPVMLVGGCVMWVFFIAALNAPTIALLMLLLAGVGFGCGALDTSMNSHAFTVEHHLGKPTLSKLHGGFSLGGVLGSVIAALLIHYDLSFYGGTLLIAALAIWGLFYAKSLCYPTDSQPNDSTNAITTNVRMPRALIVVAVLTAIAFFSEGSVSDWAGLFLRDEKSASATQTALSYGAFATGMTVARFLGDGMRARFATMPFLYVSSAFACVMMTVFLLSPYPTLALIALLGAGLGYANVVPLLFVRAANIDGVSSARGVAFAAGLGYASLLGGPALLGYITEHVGHHASFALVVLGSLAIVFESRSHIHKKQA